MYGVLFMLDMYLFIHATSDKSLGHLILIYHYISWSIYESSRSPKTMLTADLYPWTFSLAKGCKRLQSLAQRSSPWSLRWLWRSSRVQDIQDGYMMGWLIKHQSGFLISRSFDLLICFDPAVKTAWSVLGKQPSAAGNAALMPFEFGHLGMEENAENHHAAAPSLMDLCPAQETVVA